MVYLFDFDGTLVDSMGVFAQTMLALLEEYRIPYGKDMVKRITPLGYGGTADYFISLGLPEERDALVTKMIGNAREAYVSRIEAKAGVVDALRALYARGDSLNVLTASPHEALDPCLKRIGVFNLFENVWSCDDFGTTKADPEIYRMAARRLGVSPSEIVFLDDNVNACRTARSAEMRVFGVYDASSAEAEAEMRAVTERYLLTLEELL